MKYNFFPATQNEFDEIFAIMDSSFPDNEMRTRQKLYDIFITRQDCHIDYLSDEANRIVAFMVVWDLGEFIFIENFAVDESLRGKGLGSILLDLVIDKYGKEVVLEVEPPLDDYTRRRVHFYEKHDFIYNDFDYLMPSLRDGNEYLPLKIMSHKKPFTGESFEEYKKKIYRYAYDVK